METASTDKCEEYWANEPDMAELCRLYDLLSTNLEKAIAGLESLAERGSAMSMCYLADAYRGVYGPKDLEKAKYWYAKADENGIVEATAHLGRICAEEGDFDGAFQAFSRSSSRGDLPTTYRLAVMYRDGQGTQKDVQRARKLYQQATSRGHLFAKRDLATLYLKGIFGPMMFFRGLTMLVSLLFDIIGEICQAVRRGPIIDDRLSG